MRISYQRYESSPIRVILALPFEITHHGFTFVSNHVSITSGRRIWPNAEFFVRYPYLTKEERLIIQKASKGIQIEGETPPGFTNKMLASAYNPNR